MKTLRRHANGVAAWLAAGVAATCVPAWAGAVTTVTPIVTVNARATDNAGRRPDTQDPREDVLTTVGAGGQVYWSPTEILALRLGLLGEYERYLSAAVRNTYAAGGLDGSWRPDERSELRADVRASYAPDRYDPRVPYRLAIAAPDGGGLPPFVRATTTRVEGDARFERWVTERVRGRVETELSSTRYSDRRVAGEEPTSIDPRALEGRDVGSLAAEGLRSLTETWAAGVYGRYSMADYEVGPTAHSVETGVTTEWDVTEVWEARASAGANWVRVPGEQGVPTRLGWIGEARLTRSWELARLSFRGREGLHFTSGAIPAAHRREGRVEGAIQPWEQVEGMAWFAAARERSMFDAYRATGTATVLSTGASVGWRPQRSWMMRVGYEHARADTTGLVDLPYRSNLVFVGLTFTGGPFGDVPPGDRYPPVP